MPESDKYAHVNLGDGMQSMLVRIKKDPPIAEADKNKLTAWAQANGFTVSNRRRVLRAE
jgi:hypothetical protein